MNIVSETELLVQNSVITPIHDNDALRLPLNFWELTTAFVLITKLSTNQRARRKSSTTSVRGFDV